MRVEVESVEKRRVTKAIVALRHDADGREEGDAGDGNAPPEGKP